MAVEPEPPLPVADWISRSEVARLLGVSRQTALAWDRSGKLKPFEHGAVASRYRRFSRSLVLRHLNRAWNTAVVLQDRSLGPAIHV